MATSEEVEKYCRDCVSRNFVNDKNFVCKCTRELPAFEEECESFEKDEELERLTPPKPEDFPVLVIEEEMFAEENLSEGTLYAVAAYIVGAVAQGLIPVSTGRQIGFMSTTIGLVIDFTMWKGKGIHPISGVIGTVLPLISCVLGGFFSTIGHISQDYDMSYFDVLISVDYGEIFSIMLGNMMSMTTLFYGFALYEGYKFSLRAQKYPEGSRI